MSEPDDAGSPWKETRSSSGLAATFQRWTFSRSLLHQGYVLCSGFYFVVAAHLSSFQLLTLGTVMAVTLFFTDIPAGVWSDSFSRKWPLVVGHGFLAVGMVMTGLVRTFPLLLIAQVLWALGWAFSTGADVAWITDELDQPAQIARVLTGRARWDLLGGATGITVFGLLGAAIGLGPSIVVSGAAMAVVGAFVAFRFSEKNFRPRGANRWKQSKRIVTGGIRLSRRDHQIRLILYATFVINAAAMISWIFPKQLVKLGLPSNSVLWYTAIGLLSLLVGVLALRAVERHIERASYHGSYVISCGIGILGLMILTFAPTGLIGGVGILALSGISFTVTRTVSTVWINHRTSSEVRATMHSFLSQSESVGEILGGVGLAAFAHTAGTPGALLLSAGLIGVAGLVVLRAR